MSIGTQWTVTQYCDLGRLATSSSVAGHRTAIGITSSAAVLIVVIDASRNSSAIDDVLGEG
ncbi:hypothetical protein AWB94_32590 [Mycolicibacterium canariasense]|nr:hypothetical protein AWB94_32590 [Mycolicibacterium canariasense]